MTYKTNLTTVIAAKTECECRVFRITFIFVVEFVAPWEFRVWNQNIYIIQKLSLSISFTLKRDDQQISFNKHIIHVYIRCCSVSLGSPLVANSVLLQMEGERESVSVRAYGTLERCIQFQCADQKCCFHCCWCWCCRCYCYCCILGGFCAFSLIFFFNIYLLSRCCLRWETLWVFSTSRNSILMLMPIMTAD